LSDFFSSLLEVAITRDGRVYFGHGAIALTNLSGAIREEVGHGAQRKVYIRADMRARYGGVKQVLDAVSAAGIENVAFLVEEPRPSSE
jgi:biopolymer transport protein TolR